MLDVSGMEINYDPNVLIEKNSKTFDSDCMQIWCVFYTTVDVHFIFKLCNIYRIVLQYHNILQNVELFSLYHDTYVIARFLQTQHPVCPM